MSTDGEPIILMATICLVLLSEAFHTVPKLPVPSFSNKVYAADGSAGTGEAECDILTKVLGVLESRDVIRQV